MNEFMGNTTESKKVAEICTLNNLKFNQLAVVSHIKSENSEVQCRLLTMGLYPGVQIEVLRQAPLGDPLQIRAGTILMSIRRHEAAGIEVELSVK